MPKRKSVVTIDCDEVQGEDSWIKLRQLTFAEMRVLLKELHARRKKRRKEIKADLAEFGEESGVRPIDPEELEDSVRLCLDHIVAWNWVDDDGNPLPQPGECPEVLEQLTNAEMQFLGAKLGTGPADQKN